MTIVGWSPEDDKINDIQAVEPAKDNKDKKQNKDNKNKKNTSKGKTIEPIVEE